MSTSFHQAFIEQSRTPHLEERRLLSRPEQPPTEFCGSTRQAKYLLTFQAMQEEAQSALREVYHLAMQAHGGGSHVLMAYLYATRYPEVARLVIENVVLRFRLKQVQDTPLGQQIQQRLEDFHVALEAFVSDVSIETAEEHRRQTKEHPPCHWVPKQEYEGFRSILTTNLMSITHFIQDCQAKTNKLKAAVSYR